MSVVPRKKRGLQCAKEWVCNHTCCIQVCATPLPLHMLYVGSLLHCSATVCVLHRGRRTLLCCRAPSAAVRCSKNAGTMAYSAPWVCLLMLRITVYQTVETKAEAAPLSVRCQTVHIKSEPLNLSAVSVCLCINHVVAVKTRLYCRASFTAWLCTASAAPTASRSSTSRSGWQQ
jgi:hypothetical protein